MKAASQSRNRYYSSFFIRLIHWEFWPFYIVYIPVYFYFLWLSVKSRSLFFFSACNPGVDTGGLFGESKWGVLEKVPSALIPKTVLVKSGTSIERIAEKLKAAGIEFPLIAKPDIGERGFLVEKIDDASSLDNYLSRFNVDFLLQEYVDYDYEYNVLFYKVPGEATGKITSVTVKQYMSVRGDGTSTVQELMQRDRNSILQVKRFRKSNPELLKLIPAKDMMLIIEPVGNHARGTKFFDGRGMVDKRMTESFTRIANQIPGMHIFRFDVKCKKPEDLYNGFFKIVELNGAGGEPTHIYESGYSLWKAWGDLLQQWNLIYKVSRFNHEHGVPYMSLREGMSRFRAYWRYKNKLSTLAAKKL